MDEPLPEIHVIARAKQVFLAARALSISDREEFVQRECARDLALRKLVMDLLKGDELPLPIESLADDIRAAHDAAPTEQATSAGASIAGTSVIGNYRLLERVGEGGFGVVFMAEQERPVRRRVALKIIKLGMDTRQVVARFEAERQALALMDHPSIARVFDAGTTKTGRPYFVMELVRGLPITEYCDQHRLPIRERLALVTQVCEALQHAHQRGVIHRDIKPSNVLIATFGGKPVPKIIDFGIAKATSARLTEKTIFTEFRQMIGTPEYMSPEQAGESSEDVDTRTDVYAAGVLLYELLTGATPFDSQRLRSAAYGELQRIIREEDPPKPSTRVATRKETLGTVARQRSLTEAKLSSTIAGELDWIVMKSLEKDRQRRYDSAGTMAADIQRYLMGDAVEAAPPSNTYLIRKFVKRHRGPVLAGSLLAVALVAGLVGTSLGFVNADRQRRRADEKTTEALLAEADAQRRAYSANMLSACGAVETGQVGVASAFLDSAPERLRGWEWATLHAALDTSTRSLPCRTGNQLIARPTWEYTLIPLADGKSFITTSGHRDPGGQRWDTLTGRLLATFPHPNPGSEIHLEHLALHALSSDQTRFSSGTGMLWIAPTSSVDSWNIDGERHVRITLPPLEQAEGLVALHPDGRRVLRHNKGDIWLQDLATGEITARGKATSIVNALDSFNRDGSLYASELEQGDVEVFDGNTLALVARLVGHRNMVKNVAFSPDNRHIASAAVDGTVQVHAIPAAGSGESIAPELVLEHPFSPENVKYSSDGTLLATIALDRAIRVWDVSAEGVKRAATSNIGRTTADLVSTFASPKLIPGPLMFMPNGSSVAGRETDGTVRFWDVHATDVVKFRGHAGLVNGACYAPMNGLIVSIGWDGWRGSTGNVRLWDADTGEAVAALGEPGEIAERLDISPDGTLAAIGSAISESRFSPTDRHREVDLRIMDLVSGEIRRINYGQSEPLGSAKPLLGVAFDPSGTTLAVCRGEIIDILDARRGTVLKSCDVSSLGIEASQVRFSPDGKLLAVCFNSVRTREGSTPHHAALLDATTLKVLHLLDAKSSRSLTFSPDGRYVYTGSVDGEISVADAHTGERVTSFKAHDRIIMGLSFNAEGSRLASAGGDEHEITIWDTSRFPLFDRVARFQSEGFVASAAWCRDTSGTERLVGAIGKNVQIFDGVPIRERVEARIARREALAQVRSTVAGMFSRLGDGAQVVAAIKKDPTLSPLQRKTALQEALRIGLTRSTSSPQ